MRNSTSYESIIGKALLDGTKEAQDMAEARTTCKAMAQQQMFCRCGAVHDQEKIHVVEIRVRPDTGDDRCLKVVGAMCPGCWEKFDEAPLEKVAAELSVKTGGDIFLAVANWKTGYFVP